MARSSSGNTLRVLAREADAFRRQAMLLHRALAPRGVALAARGGEVDVVFLLHGLMATAGVFGPLEACLRRAGVEHIGSFTYRPFRGVASLSSELGRALRYLPPRARVHLVGHSLGGIVARYYVQEGGGAARVRQTISLASPFAGAPATRFLPGALSPLARELSPDSPLLGRLREPSLEALAVPHLSFVAADDLLLTPPEGAAFPFGEVITVAGTGHNGLLFDERVARAIGRRILSPPSIQSSRAAE